MMQETDVNGNFNMDVAEIKKRLKYAYRSLMNGVNKQQPELEVPNKCTDIALSSLRFNRTTLRGELS